MFRFMFVMDVGKIYRQILANSSRRCYQLLVWRKNKNQSLKVYRLNTVTYGPRAAQFLATKCLQQLSKKQATTYLYVVAYFYIYI